MHGYQITFFTQQTAGMRAGRRRLAGRESARPRRARRHRTACRRGFGHDRRVHSGALLRTGRPAVEVTMVASVEETERLFDHLRAHRVHVFYARTPVEFGTIGEDDA